MMSGLLSFSSHVAPSCFCNGFQEFNAKISDLGLARSGPINDDTHISTRVMGTYGYAAPEYVATGKCCCVSSFVVSCQPTHIS